MIRPRMLRAENPLTPESALRAVSSEPLLFNLTRVNLALGPYASRTGLRIGLGNVAILGTVVWLWFVNDGTLGTRQLAASG